MTHRTLTTALLAALALAALPASAATAQTTVAEDPAAQALTALDGTLVWVSGADGEPQRLMQRDATGIRPVEGAPPARFYRSPDLGRDRSGELVLTYLRCDTPSRCVARRDDLQGRRASVRLPAVRGCSPTGTPAFWRDRVAFGLSCRRGRADDPRRSGVYVRTGSGTPRRLPRPADAARFGISDVTAVDLRGTQVAAVLSDIYSYAVTQSVTGKGTRSFLAAASEGDTQADVRGLSLARGGVLWALTTAEHAGDPLQTIIYRLDGACREYQVLTGEAEAQRFPATDLAVDGGVLHLVVPDVGIVTHEFTPVRACA